MIKPTVFDVLSDVLRPYVKDMIVKSDSDTNFYLEEDLSSNKLQMFGAVQVKKNYTSFHLFPVYTHPNLLNELSSDLRKRMQGKSCFNFTDVEQVPTSELVSLVKRARESLSE